MPVVTPANSSAGGFSVVAKVRAPMIKAMAVVLTIGLSKSLIWLPMP